MGSCLLAWFMLIQCHHTFKLYHWFLVLGHCLGALADSDFWWVCFLVWFMLIQYCHGIGTWLDSFGGSERCWECQIAGVKDLLCLGGGDEVLWAKHAFISAQQIWEDVWWFRKSHSKSMCWNEDVVIRQRTRHFTRNFHVVHVRWGNTNWDKQALGDMDVGIPFPFGMVL